MKVLGVEVPSPSKVLGALPGPVGDVLGGRQRDLAGKVVAITGGAQGIGRTCAEALLEEGARVAIGDLDASLAKATAGQLGQDCVAFPLDVTDRASFRAFLDAAEEELGPIDVLVNNAGVMFVGGFSKETDAITDLQVDVNVKGVLNGCKIVLPRMTDRGEGHIVNIASAAGKAAIPNLVTYVGTKHAVVGISDALRAELRGTGVDVSTILPNAVNTDLGKGLADSIVPKVEPEDVAAALVRILKTGKAEETVPRYLAGLATPTLMLPVSVRETVTRALGGHKVMLEVDMSAREDYEARAAKPVA